MKDKETEENDDEVFDKCLRHQIHTTDRYCRLCEAKKEAKGKSEYAKKIFIRGNKYE